MGHRVHATFGQKLLNTQLSVGSCSDKSLIVKWAKAMKESSKNSLKPNRASHNNAIWHSDTDGFLEHLLSGGKAVLQRVHPPEDNSIFLRLPLIHMWTLRKNIPTKNGYWEGGSNERKKESRNYFYTERRLH